MVIEVTKTENKDHINIKNKSASTLIVQSRAIIIKLLC